MSSHSVSSALLLLLPYFINGVTLPANGYYAAGGGHIECHIHIEIEVYINLAGRQFGEERSFHLAQIFSLNALMALD